MVKLLIGHKGSGKTKTMVNMANDSLEKVNGSVVFICKNSRLMTDLKYSIRVTCMDEYPAITNVDEFIGFIYGVVSQDHDIEEVYMDSLLKYADINIDNLEDFLARLDKITTEHEFTAIVSISAEQEAIGAFVGKYEQIAHQE